MISICFKKIQILKVFNILSYLRMFLALIIGFISFFIIFGNKKFSTIGEILIGLFIILFSAFISNYIARFLITKIIQNHRYKEVFHIIANKTDFGNFLKAPKTQNLVANFRIEDFVEDNKLPLTFFLCSNSQYEVLKFQKNKFYYYNIELDWKNIKWQYYLKKQGKGYIEVVDFEGTDNKNLPIKRKIDFNKFESKPLEILTLFVVHDLIYGTKKKITRNL